MPGIFELMDRMRGTSTDKDDNFVKYMRDVELAQKASSSYFDLGNDTGVTNPIYGNTSTYNPTLGSELDATVMRPDFLLGVDPAKYNKYGVGVARHINFNKERAERQSGWEQAGRSGLQMLATIGGEALSGIGATYQIAENLLSKVGEDENEFTNLLMEYGKSLQDNTKKANPIYRVNPGKSFDTEDFSGWFWDNMPSIASSVGMFIPAGGALGILSKVNKLGKAGKFGTAFAKFAKTLDNPLSPTKNILKTGISAGIMRNAENFGESLDTYNTAKAIAYGDLSNMSQSELEQWKLENKDIVDNIISKNQEPTVDNISNYIATKSAWNTYKIDAANIVFDALQLAPLFGHLKVNTSTKLNPSSIVNANRKVAGLTPLSTGKSILNDVMYHAAKTAPIEIASEGVEEMINAVAQKEGITYAKAMLGDKTAPNFGVRLAGYLHDPNVWEQAFWGAMGGGVFSGFTRTTKGIKDLISKTDDTNSTKARLNEINSRNIKLGEFAGQLKELNDNKNPYTKTDLTDDDNVDDIRNSLIDDIAYNLGLNAARNGNINLVKNQLSSEPFIKQMAETIGVEPSEMTPILTKINTKLNQVESFYKSSASKIHNANMPEHIKDILISQMTGINNDIQKYRDASAEYAAKVLTSKTNSNHEILSKKLQEVGINIDDVYNYAALQAVKNDITSTLSSNDNKQVNDYSRTMLRRLHKSIDSKIKTYDEILKGENAIAFKDAINILDFNIIADQAHSIFFDEMSTDRENDLYEYHSNLKGKAKDVNDDLNKLADQYSSEFVNLEKTRLSTLSNEDEIESEIDKITGNITMLEERKSLTKDKEVKTRIDSVISALSSLQGIAVANQNNRKKLAEAETNSTPNPVIKTEDTTETNTIPKTNAGASTEPTEPTEPNIEDLEEEPISAEPTKPILPEEPIKPAIVETLENIFSKDITKFINTYGMQLFSDDSNTIDNLRKDILLLDEVIASFDINDYNDNIDALLFNIYQYLSETGIVPNMFDITMFINDNFATGTNEFYNTLQELLNIFFDRHFPEEITEDVPIIEEDETKTEEINKQANIPENIESNIDIKPTNITVETNIKPEIHNIEDAPFSMDLPSIRSMSEHDYKNLESEELEILDEVLNNLSDGDEVIISRDNNNSNELIDDIRITHNGINIGSLMRLYTSNKGEVFSESLGMTYSHNDSWTNLAATFINEPDFQNYIKLLLAFKFDKRLSKQVKDHKYTNLFYQHSLAKFEGLPIRIELNDKMIIHITNVLTYKITQNSTIDMNSIYNNLINWNNIVLSDMNKVLNIRKQLSKSDSIVTTINSITPGGLSNTGVFKTIDKISFEGKDVTLFFPDFNDPYVLSSPHDPEAKGEVREMVDENGNIRKPFNNKIHIKLRLAKTKNATNRSDGYKYVMAEVNSATIGLDHHKLPILDSLVSNFILADLMEDAEFTKTAKGRITGINKFANIDTIKTEESYVHGVLSFKVQSKDLNIPHRILYAVNQGGNIVILSDYKNPNSIVNISLTDVLKATYRNVDLSSLRSDKEFIDPFNRKKTYKNYKEYLIETGALVSDIFTIKDVHSKFISNSKPFSPVNTTHNMIIKLNPVKGIDANIADQFQQESKEIVENNTQNISEREQNILYLMSEGLSRKEAEIEVDNSIDFSNISDIDTNPKIC